MKEELIDAAWGFGSIIIGLLIVLTAILWAPIWYLHKVGLDVRIHYAKNGTLGKHLLEKRKYK